MMNTRTLALVPVLVVIATGSAMAQDIFHFEQIGPAPAIGLTFERPIDVMSVEPLDFGEPITGAPYSADITTEVVQPLADGNRIERRSTSLVARDSRGRVRREQQLAAIGPILPQGDARMVTVTDPVAGVHYSFDRERKVAMRSPMPIVKRIEGGVAIGPDATVPGRAIVRGRAGAMIGGRTVVAPGAAASGTESRTETLGTKDMEGVRVEGTRSTVTIPAGAIGNQAPIEIVSERWYSPELQTVVLSRRTDPRFGETTYRLENIVRTEPPADLFQVPADYKVDAMRPFGPGTFVPRPEPRPSR